MMQKFGIFFLTTQIMVLHNFVSVTNCHPSSIQEYIFPSIEKSSCLLHLILHKKQESLETGVGEQELLDFLTFEQFRNLILLTSSANNSTKQTDEDDVVDGAQKSLVVASKWRGECLRILVWNAQTFLEVLKDPQVSFWKSSELPEIIGFVFDKEFQDPGWDSDSITSSKEAGDFNGFRANLVIVVWSMLNISSSSSTNSADSSIKVQKLGFFCYMCPSESTIQWVEKEPPLFQGQGLFKVLKKNGYKRKLFLKYGTDLTNYEELSNCETVMFFHKTKDCGITTILLQMTKSALNLTVSRVLDLEDVDAPISANANILGEIPSELTSLSNDMISIFFREQTIGKLFYCTDKETFEPPSWNFFFRVIDPLIWGFIFLLGIIYAIITQSPYLGIRALLFLVGQGIPVQLSRRKILLTPLLPLILISNWYISLITMEVVIPPPIWVVTLNKQLFDLGFKFLIPSYSALPYVREKGNRSLEKFGIPWDPSYFLPRPDIIKFGSELQPEFFLKLGAVNGIYHTNVDVVRYMRRLKLLNPRNSRYGNVTCSVVEQDWDDQLRYYWLVGGYLAPQLVEIASRFVESGFNYFWTMKKHFNTVGNMQIARYCLAHTSVCGTEDVSKMAMHSSIQIIFYFLLALATVSIFIFVFEICKNKRERQKTKKIAPSDYVVK